MQPGFPASSPAQPPEPQQRQELRQQGQLHLLLESLAFGGGSHRIPRSAPRIASVPAGPRLTDPPSPSAFRTGLTDADLRTDGLAESV